MPGFVRECSEIVSGWHGHGVNPATKTLLEPDLIVRSDVLRDHWLVRVEDLPATFCSVEEGGITPGTHTLLRFTVTTPNVGTGDIFVGDPNDHIAANDG
jgi:hypothetical protein